jgi:glycosyltransferase involved in cell wall biosynthesis
MNAVSSGAKEDAGAARRQPVILQVLPSLVTGGVERGTVDVAAAIVQAGWTALVASNGGPMVRELERAGARHIELPAHSKNPLVMHANVGRLARVIREHNVDIVHARSRAPAWSALAAANKTGAHFVTTFHGTYNLGMGGLKQKYNAVMARGERVIAISHFIAEHMQRIYGVEPERIRVIHRGVDLSRLDPNRISAERIIQLVRQWRLPEGARVIMLPGRLTRWKGQGVLIDALALLGRKDIRCIMVGSDQGRTKYRQELIDQIRAKDLMDVVHLTDQCNDMPAAYKLSDIVVSASTDPEGFGRVVVEAQAMGRAVIASGHGGAAETVVPGETGWLVPPGDPQALAEALDFALRLPEQTRAWMSDNAMAHVRAHFSREDMCAHTLGVYAEVLGLTAEPG